MDADGLEQSESPTSPETPPLPDSALKDRIPRSSIIQIPGDEDLIVQTGTENLGVTSEGTPLQENASRLEKDGAIGDSSLLTSVHTPTVSSQNKQKPEILKSDSLHEIFKALGEGDQPWSEVTGKPKTKSKLTKTKKKEKTPKKTKPVKSSKKTKKQRGKKKLSKGKKRKDKSGGLVFPYLPAVSSDMATTPIGSDHGGGSGLGIAVPGVLRVTLSPSTQQFLSCVVGQNVTAESPWLFVNKSLIDDNIDLHTESSDFLPIRDDISELKTETVLLGYDALADVDNQFYICVTEPAQNAVVEILQQMKEDQQNWLKNALEKPARAWVSQGSEKEVDLFTVRNNRCLMQMQVETTIADLRSPCNFQNRDVDDVPDGYFQFPHRDDISEHISRLRVDEAIQVSLEKVNKEAQTEPGIPDNSWTQYEYTVDTEKPIEDETVEKALSQFLQGVQQDICEALHYNELMDLHRDDYGRLVRFEEDTEASQSVEYNEFMSFTDMKHSQGKVISCSAFHPSWSGIVALAYVDHIQTEIADHEEQPDEGLRDVYTMHPVLIWSFVDAFRPKLILDCPREVHALSFAPHNENILVGGLANGQFVIWDINGKIEKVEQETRMTPDQIKYNMAMNNLMDWMKSTIHIEYLQPTAVSAIDGSHMNMISQIHWVHPSWEISSTGQFTRCEDGKTSLEAVTASADGTILFWNIHPESAGIPGIPRRRKLSNRPEGLKIEKSPFSNFNRKLKPVFQLEILGEEEKQLFLVLCFSFYVQPLTYEENEEIQSKLTAAQRENMTTRFKFKPVFNAEDMSDQEHSMLVGTVDGAVMKIEWQGTEENIAEYIRSKTCSRIERSNTHASCVLSLERNPFIKHLFVSVGSRKFAVWSEKLGMTPLLWRYSQVQYTAVAWSLQRPSMLQCTRIDGVLEVWDFLVRTDTFVLKQSVSGKRLTGIDAHSQFLPNNVIGIGDYNGSFRLFFIPVQYQESDVAADIEQLEDIITREKDRRSAMAAWEERWREKNAEQARIMREYKDAESKRQAEEEEQERRMREDSKAREELELEQLQKQKDPPKHVAKLAAMEHRWQETKRSHMVRMLLDKKKLEKSDLEERRGPVVAAQNAQQHKQAKLQGILKQRNAIFRGTVKMLFPELAPSAPLNASRTQSLVSELEDMDETIWHRYREIEQLALEQVKPTPLEHSFNWKRCVQEGRERREVLDTSLFHQTARLARAEERREHRRQHRGSEMLREDAKKKPKVPSKVDFYSSATSFRGGSTIDATDSDLDVTSAGKAGSTLS